MKRATNRPPGSTVRDVITWAMLWLGLAGVSYGQGLGQPRPQPLDSGLTALAGGSDFVRFVGPSGVIREFTLPDQAATLLYSGGPLGTPSSATLNADWLTSGTVADARIASTIARDSEVAAAYQPLTGNLTSWGAISRAAGYDTFTATPSGANLASLLTTALPASKGGTGLTSLGAGVATALGQNVSGSGGIVLATAPTIAGGSVTGLTALSVAGNIEGNPALGQVNIFADFAGAFGAGLVLNKIGNNGTRAHGVAFQVDGENQFTVGMDYQDEDFVLAYHLQPTPYHASPSDLFRIDGTNRKIWLGANVADPHNNPGYVTIAQPPDNVAAVGLHFPRADATFTNPGDDIFDRIRFDMPGLQSRSWIKWTNQSGDSASDWRIGSHLDVGFLFAVSGATGKTAADPGIYVMQLADNGNVQIGSSTGTPLPVGPTAIPMRLRLAATSGARLGFLSQNYAVQIGQASDAAVISAGYVGQTAGVHFHVPASGAADAGITTGTSTLSSKAVLQSDSTTRGWLPPRMTTTQRDAITSVPEGLLVANTTLHTLDWYSGSAWKSVMASDAGQPIDAALTALAAGSDFVAFSGPSSSIKTFALPNASATILTTNAAVTTGQGGLGADNSASSGVPLFAAGAVTMTGTSGSGNFARVSSPSFTAPTLGAATATSLAFATAAPGNNTPFTFYSAAAFTGDWTLRHQSLYDGDSTDHYLAMGMGLSGTRASPTQVGGGLVPTIGLRWTYSGLEVVSAANTTAGGSVTSKFKVGVDGTVQFGTHSAIGAETVTGYITIKDAGGTTRKLAVVN